VAITDANGNVLNSQSVTNFGGGVYLVWNVSGHVKIQVTLTGDVNAVATGLFFHEPLRGCRLAPCLLAKESAISVRHRASRAQRSKKFEILLAVAFKQAD